MAASGSGQIQPLKIPDAVVALAQAAAKANNSSSTAAADATDKYLPGWPLFSPPKMQLTKCAKCPREFCSSVALRRHTRVHRRALKIDKDFPKNRDHVAAFWDEQTSSVDDDDNQGIHRHDDAPHTVQLGFNLLYRVQRLRLSAASSTASSPDLMLLRMLVL